MIVENFAPDTEHPNHVNIFPLGSHGRPQWSGNFFFRPITRLLHGNDNGFEANYDEHKEFSFWVDEKRVDFHGIAVFCFPLAHGALSEKELMKRVPNAFEAPANLTPYDVRSPSVL